MPNELPAFYAMLPDDVQLDRARRGPSDIPFPEVDLEDFQRWQTLAFPVLIATAEADETYSDPLFTQEQLRAIMGIDEVSERVSKVQKGPVLDHPDWNRHVEFMHDSRSGMRGYSSGLESRNPQHDGSIHTTEYFYMPHDTRVESAQREYAHLHVTRLLPTGRNVVSVVVDLRPEINANRVEISETGTIDHPGTSRFVQYSPGDSGMHRAVAYVEPNGTAITKQDFRKRVASFKQEDRYPEPGYKKYGGRF